MSFFRDVVATWRAARRHQVGHGSRAAARDRACIVAEVRGRPCAKHGTAGCKGAGK